MMQLLNSKRRPFKLLRRPPLLHLLLPQQYLLLLSLTVSLCTKETPLICPLELEQACSNRVVKHLLLSSPYRGELSFLPPVQFCICSCDSAILTSYLFRQGPACVHVLHWKNVLQVSGVIRCVWHFANWKNVLCHKMCMCMAFC